MVAIRKTVASELPRLASILSASLGRTLQDELDDQANGVLSLYGVWQDAEPVAYGFVAWSGPRMAFAAQELPGVPEIYRLTVQPEFQSQGIGSELIEVMEGEARARGVMTMGLGVAHSNHRAQALYLRLGYTTAISHYIDEYKIQNNEGAIVTIREPCKYMIKPLS